MNFFFKFKVRYRFNVTGENPEFEVSMDNRSTEKLQKAYKQPQVYGVSDLNV